jgi:hypothetical protein
LNLKAEEQGENELFLHPFSLCVFKTERTSLTYFTLCVCPKNINGKEEMIVMKAEVINFILVNFYQMSC